MGPGRILVVEDPLVRRLIDDILTRVGYTVVEADPEHARELLADKTEKIALLVTNTPERFADYAQAVPLLYVSAFPEPRTARQFPRCRALAKPFAPLTLLALARELLEPVREPARAGK